MKKADVASFSQLLLAGAFISVILAAVGWLSSDIWLAPTQWLLVGIVLALFGTYFRK